METKRIRLSDLVQNEGQVEGLPKNPRSWTREGVEQLAKSIKETPELLEARGLIVYPYGGKYLIIGGNMRYDALRSLKAKDAPCFVLPAEMGVDKLKELVIKDNGAFGAWDYDELANIWDDLALADWGVPVWTPEVGEVQTIKSQEEQGAEGFDKNAFDEGYDGQKLADRFIVPPFSVLNTTSKEWQERKQTWRALIGDNGESREKALSKGDNMITGVNNGVSILDPVLAEIVCKWFGTQGGKAFDCFAGDSVFGWVASHLGFDFTGIELRPEQVELNTARVQGKSARYICDDGQRVEEHIPAQSQDLLFSCPPYYDLEVYSDRPDDASNQETYEEFLAILEHAFTGAITCLKPNRFAVVVVGDIRDKRGYYYDFVGDIKRIFRAHGMGLYNEIILLDSIGTAPMRANRYMSRRKVVKRHQNILVFFNGDPAAITKEFPSLDYTQEELAEMGGEAENEG